MISKHAPRCALHEKCRHKSIAKSKTANRRE
jgi:hypothetical protein